MTGIQFPVRKVKGFSTMSRLALGPTQPPVHLVSKLFPWSEVDGMKLTAHLYLVMKLGIQGAVPPLSLTSSWCGA